MGRLRALLIGPDGQAGYSLIGTALFILVIGILSIAGIAVYQQYDWTQKNTVTNETLASLKQAMARYKSLEGNLPCPAPLDARPDSAEFGVADCSVGAAATGRGGESIRYGAVPVRTLNISESLAFDGWKHRIVYAVTEYYTGSPSDHADRGAIRIVDGDGNIATNEDGNIIYTLLAPGADSRGTFSVHGEEIADCSETSDAGENCNNDGTLLSNIMRQWGTGNSEYTSKLNYVASSLSYEWRTEAWSACADDVPGQVRTVTCYISGTNTPAPGKCAESLKPAEEQECSGQEWAYRNVPCPDRCGPSFQVDKDPWCRQNDGEEIPDSACQLSHGDPAAVKQTCTPSYNPCPQWHCPTCSGGGGSYSSSSGGGGGSDGGVTHYSHHGEQFTVDDQGNSWSGWTQYDTGTPTSYYGGSSSSGSSSSGSSSSGGGTSSVICTHFYRRGKMSRELWRNDLEFTFNNLPWTTVRGYQLWGIPAVYLMRKYPWTEAIFYPLAINRAEEIAYQAGLRDKPNYKGKLIRWIFEPICFVLGLFVPEQKWEKVHADMEPALQ